MLKAKQKLLKWPEVRAGGEAVRQNYGVKPLNRDRQPLEKNGAVSFILDLREIIRPSCRRKSMAESLIGLSVSTAIGWKANEAGRSAYLTSFLEAAAPAAAAAVTEEA